MKLRSILPYLIILGLRAESPEAKKMDGVSQAAIQSAFQILRSDYIRSSELTFDELNRASILGLLERLDLGAEMLTKVDAQRPLMESGLLAEMLTPEIAYVRPFAFTGSEAVKLAERLRFFQSEKVTQLIFDLRSAAPPGDFSVAAALLECFVPENELLFKLKQVGREDSQLFIGHSEPVWTQPLLVLVDEETGNLGETIAAVLRHRKQALLIGSATRGATVQYETTDLDDHWVLRFARAEMLLADDQSVFKQGLKPDFMIELAAPVKRLLFDASSQRPPIKETLFDRAKPRYNEAALVAGKHPELDDYVRRSAGKKESRAAQVPRDLVLQRAVDMLITRHHLDSQNLDWSIRSRDAHPTIRKAERSQ